MRPARQRSTRMRHGLLRAPRSKQLAAVDAYVGCGLSVSTQRGYASDLAHFKAWGGTVPCSAHTVARYVAAFAGSLKVSTLLRHLAAIARGHVVGGFESPTSAPLVRATLRGIRRVHGTAQKQANPITVAMLRKLVRPVPTYSALRNLRDRALLLVGFAGGFRRSELAALTTGSVSFTRRGAVLHLRAGKTDPNGVGRHIAVPFGTPPLCPVRALREWIKATRHLDTCPAQGGAPSSPLFRRIDRYGHPGGGLCDAAVGWILTQRMQAVGLCTQGFSAHSLRAGLVTSAAKAGVPTWAIQRQTGHKSEHMVRRYIRGLGLFEQNALKSVL
ncbi:site-specific integrase [Polaromonas sp. C04]|uniref:site-specific integrase n=1 Tax=Polaromonas sp. C04 TaxID=1945857 RepID=UPI000984B5C2|nr:site-specific integrase [Polaromonas sp. C04]